MPYRKSILEIDDVLHMVRLFNVGFDTKKIGFGCEFTITDFGVMVIFNIKDYSYNYDDWRYINIKPSDNLEDKRIEVLWELVKGGYFHYIRNEYPNTFKKMLAIHNYDKMLLSKRLEIFGDKPKYNYFKKLNEQVSNVSSTFIMSAEPSFFDFLHE